MQQLLQSMRSSTATASGATSATSSTSAAAGGQDFPGVGGKGPPPPPPAMGMQGSSGEGFSGETLSSLISLQETERGGEARGGKGLFEALDTDADGALSTDELTSALTSALGDAADVSGAVSTLVSDGDYDGDGQLSGEEFHALARASGPPPGGPPPAGETKTASGAGGASRVFDALDTNQDGTISAAELAAADTDGDGGLSGDEFTAMLKAAESKTASASTDGISSLTSASSGSNLASDLMQKLLAQLESAQAATASRQTVNLAA
jgi:Ca2+-binding EF-hand superfamily protein